MPQKKSETITIRVAPAVKNALRAAASREHRSLANMVEVMIRDYCAREGVDVERSSGEAAAKIKGEPYGA